MMVEIDPNTLEENKVKTFKADIREVSRKVIDEWKKVNIKLSYFWDSHGKKIPWEHNGKKSETIKDAHVIVEEVVRSMPIIGTKDYTWTEWEVTVNGEKVNVIDCIGYKGNAKTKTIDFKMIAGQG